MEATNEPVSITVKFTNKTPVLIIPRNKKLLCFLCKSKLFTRIYIRLFFKQLNAK